MMSEEIYYIQIQIQIQFGFKIKNAGKVNIYVNSNYTIGECRQEIKEISGISSGRNVLKRYYRRCQVQTKSLVWFRNQ